VRLGGLLIAAITAITGFSAGQACIIALAVLFLAVGLLAVAALVGVAVVIEGSAFELLFGLCEDGGMFVMVEAAVACALGGAHLSDGEALTVHFDAVCFLAGAS
jgi:hypothetical protein